MRDCDDQDRDNFIEHRGDIFTVTQTDCFAWALLANPMRIILLCTDQTPIVTVMIGKKPERI
jgi:putative transposase